MFRLNLSNNRKNKIKSHSQFQTNFLFGLRDWIFGTVFVKINVSHNNCLHLFHLFLLLLLCQYSFFSLPYYNSISSRHLHFFFPPSVIFKISSGCLASSFFGLNCLDAGLVVFIMSRKFYVCKFKKESLVLADNSLEIVQACWKLQGQVQPSPS